MAGAQFSLESLGRAQERLELLAASVRDLTGPLREIGDYLVSRTKRRFDVGRGPDGIAWEPSRRALDEGGKTLVDRGHLRDSISRHVGKSGVVVGSGMVYAAIHEFGGRAGRHHAVHLPARPYLALDQSDHDYILEVVDDWLRRVLR